MRKFHDNSVAPIVAMDFDGTLCEPSDYPLIGNMRQFADKVMRFMIDIGIKVVINTSRDVAIVQDEYRVIDDVTPMVNWLADNNITYSAINKSIQFAPFFYNSRKIYAHRYIDDRSPGWVESKMSMIYVLADILENLLDIHHDDIGVVTGMIARGEEIGDDIIGKFRKYVEEFWV